MKSIFRSDDHKIKNLLQEHEKRMIIPNYQREYVWKEDESQEFLEDVIEQKDKALFIGSIILQEDSDSQDVYIVDGQQRITTILIFLIALRVFVGKFDNSELKSEIQRYISFKINKNEPRLKTSGRIAKPFEVMCDIGWDGKYDKKMGSIWDWKIINKSYEFFYNELKSKNYSEQEVERLFNKICQIDYIHISVEKPTDAIATFERVNARGQHLEVYDLIKAFLFNKALEDKESDEIKKELEEDWKNIRDYDEECRFKLKDILLYFYLSKEQYKSNLNLYTELKNIAEEDPKKFIKEIKHFSQFYSIVTHKKYGLDESEFIKFLKDESGLNLGNTSIIRENRADRIVQSLFSIGFFNYKHIYYLIYKSLLALSTNIQENGDSKDKVDAWIELIEFFEDYFFVTSAISHRSSQHSSQLRSLCTEYCQNFDISSRDNNFVEVIDTLKTKMSEMINIPEAVFVEEFMSLTYQNRNDKSIIHYIFDRFNATTKEDERIRDSNISRIFKPKYTIPSNTIEHILPQNPPNDDYKDNAKEALHSIGNLIILDGQDNSTLGNKTPNEKVQILKQWLDNGEIQNKQYIQEFIDYYQKEITDKGLEWNEETIEQRGRDLAKRMYDITYYKDKK